MRGALARAASFGRGLGPARRLAAGLALTGALFALAPSLDLAAARLFFRPGEGFPARTAPTLDALRDVAFALPYAVLGLTTLAWLLARLNPRASIRPRGRAIAFLALSLALGPGLLVNGVLKQTTGRPRPAQVAEFGGPHAFLPWWITRGPCPRNCAFVSGEAAGSAWLVAAASLARGAWRLPALVGAGAVMGGVMLLRVAQGGHFPSDVIMAALLTLLVAEGVARALRLRTPRGTA